ncbi:Sterile alpha motif domain-containing 3 [Labeo rohita]|uniref:Sterile alpha motif domain-containing 3 n=1 Tax=Labeo rohita TaxID=84645 RepID=A0A498MRD4_LABRO|nr:Sterile alpha motif domain-containing 3 [Labeo rohita]
MITIGQEAKWERENSKTENRLGLIIGAMAGPVKLRVILADNDDRKLILPKGMPKIILQEANAEYHPASNDMWGPDEGFMGGKCGPHYGLTPGIHIGASRGSPDVLKVGPVRINSEFMRITTVPLEFKFLAVLDQYSDSLMKIFHTKGGVNGRTIKNIMQPISQDCDWLIAKEAMKQTVMVIYIVRHEGHDPVDQPVDVGVVTEGTEVLSSLRKQWPCYSDSFTP